MEKKYHTLSPWIVTRDTAQFIDFLKAAFNAHAWGDRIGRVRDPFGNIWWITTHVEDLSPEEIAMKYAQDSFNLFHSVR